MDYKIEIVVDNVAVKCKTDVAPGKLAETVKNLTLWAQSKPYPAFDIRVTQV